MLKPAIRFIPVFFASMLLFGCSEKLELKVIARMNGTPAAEATVMIDGERQGVTDGNGAFAKIIRKKPGADVEVTVSKDMPGYRIQPWKGSFLVKLPKSGKVDVYSLDANLSGLRYVTVVATDKGVRVADAAVKAGEKEVGKTDAAGEFIYEYKDSAGDTGDLAVTKTGYGIWRNTGPLEPGQRLEAALSRRVLITVTALAEEYGHTTGIPGVKVSLGKRQVARTDSKGMASYSYEGEPGKEAQIVLTAPGYLPAVWKTTVILEGDVAIRRYFYSATQKPIRAGIYRFVSNSPDSDLKDILDRAEIALSAELFKNSCFREVPSEILRAEVKRSKSSIEKIAAKGWQETALRRTVDMIILGSVAQDDKGLLIETKFYTSGGKLMMSHMTRARGAGDIDTAAREIASNVLERFPFEGTVIGSEDEQYRINMGKAGYRISRGMELALMAPRLDEAGRIAGYRERGKLKVKKAEEAGAWTEVKNLKEGERVHIGDRVVRRVYREGEEEGSGHYFILSAKGGLPPDVSPLGGVNIYVNDEWLGSTGPDGKAEVPVRIGRKFNLVLYRHGYQQIVDTVKIGKNKAAKEFVLNVKSSLFKIDSEPSSAGVFVDEEKIGKTPILEGQAVNLGFHTVKVSYGGDYRDWEEVVEFDETTEDRTGTGKILLVKDWLRIAERALRDGNIDAAILAYKSTETGHPDYSEAHHRLARIYLDDKNDYIEAIREFENVLALPENRQLVHKQFAVAFTNLGHAYYEKGNSLVQKDRDGAALDFAKAIQNLQIAKQNTRFFPNIQYDEALHDTYYYTALAYHKLYLITRKTAILGDADLAWREYFDFFPKKLEGNSTFDQARESARNYWDQIRSL